MIRRQVAEHDLLRRTFDYRFQEKVLAHVGEVGGGFNSNRFRKKKKKTLKICGIIARGCLRIWKGASSSRDLSNSHAVLQSCCRLRLCSQKGLRLMRLILQIRKVKMQKSNMN